MANGHRPIVWILRLVGSNRNNASANDALVDHPIERWVGVGLAVDLVPFIFDECEYGYAERVNIYRSATDDIDVEESLARLIGDHNSELGRRYERYTSSYIANYRNHGLRDAGREAGDLFIRSRRNREPGFEDSANRKEAHLKVSGPLVG